MAENTCICYECGRTITFFTKNGRVRPLHRGERRCKPRGRYVQLDLTFPVIFDGAFEEPVTQQMCGGLPIEQVTLAHGKVSFERTEWPWKRHACSCHGGYDYFGVDLLARQAEGSLLQPSLALVAGSFMQCFGERFHVVAVQELAKGGARYCLKLRGDRDLPGPVRQREWIKPGSLVALLKNGVVRGLRDAGDTVLECVEAECSPEELGIPAEWNGSGLLQI